MKNLPILLLCFASISALSSPPKPHPYSIDYLVDQPILFGEGIITTSADEFGGTFTPDGTTIFFSKSVLRFYLDIICYSQFKDGKWQTPEVAPFSCTYRDFDPVLSPDGNKMVSLPTARSMVN